MSPDKWRWAMRLDLPLRDKMVLVALAYHQDDRKGDFAGCFPSVATIARTAGASQDSVMRALQVLEGGGLISVDRTGRSHRYRLNASKVAPSDSNRSQPATHQVAGCDPNGSIEWSINKDEEEEGSTNLIDFFDDPARLDQLREKAGPAAPEATDTDIQQAIFDADMWATDRGQRVKYPLELVLKFLVEARKKGRLETQLGLSVIAGTSTSKHRGAAGTAWKRPVGQDIVDVQPPCTWAMSATGTNEWEP